MDIFDYAKARKMFGGDGGSGGCISVGDDINMDELTPLLIHENIKSYTNSQLVTFAGEEFMGKTSLVSVNCKNATTVGVRTFYGCTSLENLNIMRLSAGDSAFYGCSSLKKLPVRIDAMGVSAFENCTSLEQVAVYASIPSRAFMGCISLKALIIRDTVNVIGLVGVDAFSLTPIINGTGYIYVPSKKISEYKSHTTWSQFSSQMRVLEDYTVDGTTSGQLDPDKI